MLLSATTRGDTVHVLMKFLGLSMLPTISSNTGALSLNQTNRGWRIHWRIYLEPFGLEDWGSGSLEVPSLGYNNVEG